MRGNTATISAADISPAAQAFPAACLPRHPTYGTLRLLDPLPDPMRYVIRDWLK